MIKPTPELGTKIGIVETKASGRLRVLVGYRSYIDNAAGHPSRSNSGARICATEMDRASTQWRGEWFFKHPQAAKEALVRWNEALTEAGLKPLPERITRVYVLESMNEWAVRKLKSALSSVLITNNMDLAQKTLWEVEEMIP